MNNSFSNICDHPRLVRINNNFVRCSACGQSLISQQRMPGNKTIKEFTTENKSFVRNFDRNFTNVLEEVDAESSGPIYEYYTDRIGANKIIIDRTVRFLSDPPKYEVIVNESKIYITGDEINKLLSDINAVKIDRDQFKRTPL